MRIRIRSGSLPPRSPLGEVPGKQVSRRVSPIATQWVKSRWDANGCFGRETDRRPGAAAATHTCGECGWRDPMSDRVGK